jgi:hypothetical protein
MRYSIAYLVSSHSSSAQAPIPRSHRSNPPSTSPFRASITTRKPLPDISILTLLDQIQNTTSATIPSRSHSSLPLFSLSVFSTRAAASVIQMRTVARRGSDAGTVSMYLVRITICICRPAYSVRACPLPFYAPNSARQYGRHAQDFRPVPRTCFRICIRIYATLFFASRSFPCAALSETNLPLRLRVRFTARA